MIVAVILEIAAGISQAANYDITDQAASFASAISNAGNGDTIKNSFTMTAVVNPIQSNVTIIGGGNVINANGFRPFFVDSGTLRLSGLSTYAGATNVNSGVLQAGVLGAISPMSAFTITTGATLDFNSFNQTIGSLAAAGHTRRDSCLTAPGCRFGRLMASGTLGTFLPGKWNSFASEMTDFFEDIQGEDQ